MSELKNSVNFVRIVACGSVDDGKSTLIGRLLHDTGSIREHERDTLAADSVRHGTQGKSIDYALLLDGLEAEREQGITIDVAWRHLQTATRRYLIADCPGHVQYTRNMATGASRADLAIVLVDATKGLLPQTFRHTAIAALFGVQHVLLAVNKMDRMGHDRVVFDAVSTHYQAHAAQLGIENIVCIPMSATSGENIVEGAAAMPWYTGPSVIDYLDSVPIADRALTQPAYLPVQSVLRGATGERWVAGTLASGRLRVGDPVAIEPAGTTTQIAALHIGEHDLNEVTAGRALTMRLREDIDTARGNVIAAANHSLASTDQFAADVLWFDEAPLLPGRRYQLRLAATQVGVRVSELKHRFDPETLQPLAAKRLISNDIGELTLSLDAPIVFTPYAENKTLGGFILVDSLTRATVGCGMIKYGLRRAENIHWQRLDVDRRTRAGIKGQRPRCVWFTGLSGAGKSTIANLVERGLFARGCHTYMLDGDNVRHGLNRDLGFTDEDRVENLRRIAEVAKLMTEAGLIVLVSTISPFRNERAAARALFAEDEFVEVFVDTPLIEAERRDTKGLYAKARRGELPHFTGVDSAYEAPENAELVLNTMDTSAESLAERVIARLLDS